MSDKILVTYATKHGATTEIAEKIGQVFRDAGLAAEVLPVNQVKDVESYKAVILGSAVYMGQWRKDAASFVKSNEHILTELPVWLFSTGPTDNGDPVELLKGWCLPGKLQPIVDRIQPKDIAVFHGSLDLDNLGFFEKWIINKVKAPSGDFRNWDSITA